MEDLKKLDKKISKVKELNRKQKKYNYIKHTWNNAIRDVEEITEEMKADFLWACKYSIMQGWGDPLQSEDLMLQGEKCYRRC